MSRYPRSEYSSPRKVTTHSVTPRGADGIVRCYKHNEPASRHVSHTDKNPDRPFYKCSIDPTCGFWSWEDLIAPYPGGRSRSSSPTPVVPRNSQTQQPTNSQPLRDTEMSSSHSMQYPVPVSPSKRGRGDSSPDAKSPTMPASKRVASGNMSSTSTASMASPSTRKTLTPAEMRKRHEAILTAQQLIPSQEIDVIPSQESTVSGDAEDTLVRLDTEIQNMRNLLHSLQSSQQRDESPIEVEEMTAMSRGTQANLFEDENEAKFWAGTSFNTESSIESHNPGSSRPPRLPAVIPENTSIEWDPTPRRPSTPQANTTHARDGNGGASTKMLPTPPNSSQAEHVRAYSMAESHYRNTNEDDDDELPKTPTRSKGKERELPTTPTSSQWQRTRAEPANPLHQPVPALNVQNSPVNGASVPVTPSSPGAVTADTMEANLLEALKGVEYTKKLERKYHAAQQSIQKRDDRIKALNEENKRLHSKVQYLENAVEQMRASRAAPSRP